MIGPDIKEHLNTLRKEMMFDMLDDEDIEKISPFFEVIVYPANKVIFKEGDLGDFIGFVLAGKLEVKKQTEFKGNQLIIALLSKGAMVGELSMFDQHKRSATVEAVEETTLMILRNEAMESLIKQHPYTGIKILKALIRILALRLRKATERLTTIF
jgi:CRP/FNR family transcriptional regulator, cyclic AMP receptor protein